MVERTTVKEEAMRMLSPGITPGAQEKRVRTFFSFLLSYRRQREGILHISDSVREYISVLHSDIWLVLCHPRSCAASYSRLLLRSIPSILQHTIIAEQSGVVYLIELRTVSRPVLPAALVCVPCFCRSCPTGFHTS